jgi:hypothetical protein
MAASRTHTVGILLENTLCVSMTGKLEDATPIVGRVSVVNTIFAKGHKVIIMTTLSDKSAALVDKCLLEWGVNYDDVHYNYPKLDIFTGAQAINPEDLFGYVLNHEQREQILQSVFLSENTR